MRLRIDKIWFIVVALVLSVPSAHAQIVTANPLEWMALAEGNEAINGEIEKEIKGQTKTALLQNTIAAEFTKIHEWEKEVQQLSENRQWLCLFPQSLYLSVRRWSEDIHHLV